MLGLAGLWRWMVKHETQIQQWWKAWLERPRIAARRSAPIRREAIDAQVQRSTTKDKRDFQNQTHVAIAETQVADVQRGDVSTIQRVDTAQAAEMSKRATRWDANANNNR
ncbi:MAG: hypothetical protein M3Z31_13090 [Pseudomonadota bacterium]|nr:hypothetical protein [Pseudomonadota bacterium]